MKDMNKLLTAALQLPRVASTLDNQAWLIMPGGGSHEAGDSRLQDAKWDTKKVLVCGTRGDPSYALDDVAKLLSRNGRIPEELLFQGFAAHTREQMEWAVNALKELRNVTHVVMSTAEYHLPRCILTFMKQWMLHGDGRTLTVSAAPTKNPPPETTSGTTSATLEDELERIKLYQTQGDVATLNEFLDFVQT